MTAIGLPVFMPGFLSVLLDEFDNSFNERVRQVVPQPEHVLHASSLT